MAFGKLAEESGDHGQLIADLGGLPVSRGTAKVCMARGENGDLTPGKMTGVDRVLDLSAVYEQDGPGDDVFSVVELAERDYPDAVKAALEDATPEVRAVMQAGNLES